MAKKNFKSKEQLGAYDLNGTWWTEEELQTFTGALIKSCFGKEREEIKLINKK